MTPEEKRVVQAAIDIRNQLLSQPYSPPDLGRLRNAVDALVYACPQCNYERHTCPGDGKPIEHGETDCGEHGPCNHDGCSLDVRGNFCARGHVQIEHGEGDCGEHDDRLPISDVQKRLAPYLAEYAANVAEEWMRIVEIDEDAIEPGSGAMQLRARWLEDHSFKLGTYPESDDFGYYRLNVSVEPYTLPPMGPENDPALAYEQEEEPVSTPDVPEWVETTWLYVRTGDHVRLNGQEADVVKHTANDFHAAVDTWNDRTTGRPRDNVTGRWDHKEVTVELAHLKGKPLPFPPNSAVEVLMDAERKAIHLLAVELGGQVIS